MSTTCSPVNNGGRLYAVWKRPAGIGALILIWGLFLPGFKRQPFIQPANADVTASKWMYDSMKVYYYWADQMPSHPDYGLPTPGFF